MKQPQNSTLKKSLPGSSVRCLIGFCEAGRLDRFECCRHIDPTGSVDKEMTSSVPVLAMLLVAVCADELVLQLSGDLRKYPESSVKARIMRGVISQTPRVNSKGMRYWVQIARDNVVFIPNFGFQTIVPYGRRRLVRLNG